MVEPVKASRRVLITAGGTREAIDAVRYIGNRSSGKMGFALGQACAERGYEVVIVAANVALPVPDGCRVVPVESAQDLLEACLVEFPLAGLLIKAAAVADFKPLAPEFGKIKKSGREGLTIELVPTTDVLKTLSSMRTNEQVLVGFAAEHGDRAIEYAKGKLVSKGLDAVVVNDVSQAGIAFDAAENEVSFVTADQVVAIPRATKLQVAHSIIEQIERLH